MTDAEKPAPPLWLRLWPIYLIAGGLVAAWRFELFEYLSLDKLREQQDVLAGFVADNWLLAGAAYVGIYAAATLFMIPGALWITIAGGFMFGIWGGSIATIIGATLGASLLFFAAKTSVGDSLRKLAGSYADRVRDEFQQSPLSYMFAMRFVPAMPFPIANIVPALLGAKYRDYFVTTAFGIIPGVFAYTLVGTSIGELGANEDPDFGAIAKTLLPAGIVLLIVSIAPVIYKKFFAKKSEKLEGTA